MFTLSFQSFISITPSLQGSAGKNRGKNTSRPKEETLELGAGTTRCPLRVRALSVRFWFLGGRGGGRGGAGGVNRASFVTVASGSLREWPDLGGAAGGLAQRKSRAGRVSWKMAEGEEGGASLSGRLASRRGRRPEDFEGLGGAARAGDRRAAPRALTL